MKKLVVNEIFYSLQGEGFHTGTPAVFIRLAGCNLRCPFCDTDHSHGEPMSVEQIVSRASEFPGRVAILTGGEPTLQEIEPLIDALHSADFKVHIETNGTCPVPTNIDWITCSPKEGAPVVLSHCDELKVVYTGQDVEAIAALTPATYHFLQPCSGMNTAEVVSYILSHPRWRLSLQTHKLIDIQ